MCSKLTSGDANYKCYKRYALDDGDSATERELCKGGEITSDATPVCTTISEIDFNSGGSALTSPYACDVSVATSC